MDIVEEKFQDEQQKKSDANAKVLSRESVIRSKNEIFKSH